MNERAQAWWDGMYVCTAQAVCSGTGCVRVECGREKDGCGEGWLRMTRYFGLGSLVKAPQACRQKAHQLSLGGGSRCSLAFARRFQSARLSLLYYSTEASEQLVSAMGIVALATNDVIGNTRSKPVSVLLRRLI